MRSTKRCSIKKWHYKDRAATAARYAIPVPKHARRQRRLQSYSIVHPNTLGWPYRWRSSSTLFKEALINLQKLLRAIKEHQTRGILQRFPEILKWGYAPLRGGVFFIGRACLTFPVNASTRQSIALLRLSRPTRRRPPAGVRKSCRLAEPLS